MTAVDNLPSIKVMDIKLERSHVYGVLSVSKLGRSYSKLMGILSYFIRYFMRSVMRSIRYYVYEVGQLLQEVGQLLHEVGQLFYEDGKVG